MNKFKKLLVAGLVCTTAVAGGLCLTGCGNNETNAESEIHQIYDKAVSAGYEGTYEEWLASIKGEKGEEGKKVEMRVSSTHIQWRYEGDTEWTNLVALSNLKGTKGDTGAQGAKGDKGDTGANGNGWYSGTGEPSSNLGTTGDFYLDTTTYDIYANTYGTWGKIGNIQGNKGTDGLTPFIGENGNWWIGDTDTGVMAEQRKLCTVTFVCDIPGCELSSDLTETTVKYGENISELPIPTNVFGYEFTGWYSTTDGEITVNDAKISTLTPVTRDIVLKATFDNYTKQRSVKDDYFTYNYDNYTEITSIDCSWQTKGDGDTYLPVSQNLNIPNGTTKIAQTAFNSWPVGLAVSNATIPSSVKLSEYNFSQARFISCEFSNKVRSLPKGLFSGNSYITNVKALNLNTVGDNTFYGSNIKHIQMNTRLVTVGEYAFAECSKFIGVGANIDINDAESYSGMLSIGKEAFRNCILLEDIEYDYWTKLGTNVFVGCANLKITLVDLDEDFVMDESHQFIVEGLTLKVHSTLQQFLPTFITDGTLYTESYTPDEDVSGAGVYTYTKK